MGKTITDTIDTHNTILDVELHELRWRKKIENEIKYYKGQVKRMRIIKWSMIIIVCLVYSFQIFRGWIDWQNENKKTELNSDSHSIQFE